ncbi:MAG: hypothetical protein M3119_10370 [Verrucomicrobiota bacterium]|nr:hypothetical protein [Verrucomicrobiota bacterium]MDQ6940545.1 hypothetical protein [Verrucomicrobiota bacterium]
MNRAVVVLLLLIANAIVGAINAPRSSRPPVGDAGVRMAGTTHALHGEADTYIGAITR